MSSSYGKELKFREAFQNAIRENYQKIIEEFVRSPETFNNFTRELYEKGIFDSITKNTLLDSRKDRVERAEKLVSEVSISCASSIRIFIRLFKQNSQDIYYDIISNNKNKFSNQSLEKIEFEFFGEDNGMVWFLK